MGQLRVVPTANVLSWRYWLQVCGVHTCRDATEMVELEAGGDGTDLLLVHRAMGQDSTTSDTHVRISSGGARSKLRDPAGRFVAAVLNRPEFFSQAVSALKVAAVTTDVSHRLTRDVAVARIRHRSDRSETSATAPADPGRVGRLDDRPLATRPVSTNPLAFSAFLMLAVSSWVDACVLAASTLAKHRPILKYSEVYG